MRPLNGLMASWLVAAALLTAQPAPSAVAFTLTQEKATISVPASFSAKVVGVKDGDTVEILYGGYSLRVRLAHIDAPESGQPFGKAAKQRLAALCHGKVVKVERAGRPDRYGRLISVLYADGVNVNRSMVRSGYAWHFTKYSKDASYAEAQREARAGKRGLWGDPGAISPWDWRAARRGRKR
jgi:endonuclease YncB( thermonuclease family)